MLQKVYAALPLPGSSSASSKGAESRQSTAASTADDADATRTPFILPSTLCKAPSTPMGLRVGCHRAVRPVTMECGLGMNYDTDSDNDPEDSWAALPRRELSANAL